MLETLRTQIYKETHTADEVKRQKNKAEVEALKEQVRQDKESRFVATGIDKAVGAHVHKGDLPVLANQLGVEGESK